MRRRTTALLVAGSLALGVAVPATAATLITGKQVKDSSLTGKDIKNRSLSAADLSRSTIDDMLASTAIEGPSGPAGPQGPQGPAGPAGPQGPAGGAAAALGAITDWESGRVYFAGNYAQSAIAYCPAGQYAVSGGGASISSQGLAAVDALSDRSGWYAVGADNSATPSAYVIAYAYCAPAGTAVTPMRRSQVLEPVRELEAQLAAAARR